ncbi:MAG: metallopeptidase family protein [Clostridiales bacterium]|jgi:predicted Zn-dependent protease with MMP-like domain|nr:metallopeptidase family protein [Clostridiales bacterium]
MLTIEDMQAMLDDIAAEFPPEFFAELNGGIILLPEAKRHEKSKKGDLFILGSYNRGGNMGRYITIYYGSFMKVYGHLSGDRIREKLRRTVRHEFRHHMESLAGADDLERIDREYIADYQTGRDYEDD